MNGRSLDPCARAGVDAKPTPFGPAYLGPSIDDAEVSELVGAWSSARLVIARRGH